MAKFSNSIYFPDLVGSIGGLTIQENGSGNIIRIKPKRSKPNTERQNNEIINFTSISQSWQQLTRPEQILWDNFASVNTHINLWNQTRNISGFAFFVLCNYNLSLSGQATITTPPTYTVPTLAASIELTVSSTAITLELITPTISVGDIILVSLTQPLKGLNFLPRKEIRLMKYITYAGINTFDLTSEWENYFNLSVNADLYSTGAQIWCAASCFNSSTGIPTPYLTTESQQAAAWSDTLAVTTGATTQYMIYNGAGLPPNINQNLQLSVSLWFFVSNSGLNSVLFYIGDQTFTGINYLAIRQNVGGILQVDFYADNGTGFTVDSFAQVLFDGFWYNIIVTFDGTGNANSVKFYINGVPTGVNIVSDTLAGDITTVNGVSLNNISDVGSPFSTLGAFDEVSIWLGELLVPDVLNIYNGGCPSDLSLGGFSSPLFIWWRMGENSVFPTVTDEQGNWDLTLVGIPAPGWFNFVPCP